MDLKNSFKPRRNIGSHKPAQISLEALLLFAVFLSILAIALAASSNIGAMAQKKLDSAISQQAFNDFSSKTRQACLLGSGNVRLFEPQGREISISKTGEQSVSFSLGNHSYNLTIPCRFGNVQASGSGELTIINEGGAISIFASAS